MIMEQSLRESNQSQAVREVMQNGFTLDQALRAQSFVGDDALLMIDFIMSNLM